MAHYDAIVIGGGPGGYLAAERLGHAGRKVLLVEKEFLGGTCLNVGCIPTKSLLNGAKLYLHAREGEKFGVNAPGLTFDWDRMQAWKAEVVRTLVSGVAAVEKRMGVEVVMAAGRLVAAGRVEVGGVVHTATDVILATGSVPVMPPIPGAADNPAVVDSTGMLAIDRVPPRLAVIGGGVIGVEFASLFAALGSQVTIVEMLDEILPFADADIAAVMRRGLAGVTVNLGCRVERLDGGTVHYTDPAGNPASIEADTVLMAVGRRPLVDGWGAREAGLDVSGRGVVTDERQRTNLPHVWAVGDVTGKSLLAHAAYRMGEVAVANILDPVGAPSRGEVLRLDTIPWAVYSIPEAAGVGLTEREAVRRGHRVAVAKVPFVLSGRFVAENGLKAPGQAKLIADADTRRVLGLHLVGPYSPETIWGAAAVLETELTVDELRQLVFPHPTVSEVVREAAWAVTDH